MNYQLGDGHGTNENVHCLEMIWMKSVPYRTILPVNATLPIHEMINISPNDALMGYKQDTTDFMHYC